MSERPDRPASFDLPPEQALALLLNGGSELRERTREFADQFLVQRERFRARLAQQIVMTYEYQIRQGSSRHGKLAALEMLSALHDLEAVLREQISATVAECRVRRASWAQIGESLSVTKQAAHHRFTSVTIHHPAAVDRRRVDPAAVMAEA